VPFCCSCMGCAFTIPCSVFVSIRLLRVSSSEPHGKVDFQNACPQEITGVCSYTSWLSLFRSHVEIVCVCVCVCWDWDLNAGFCTCKAGALPLEPHLQSILFCLFWRWGGLSNYFPGRALNLDPPDLSLPN
jgi:hypothetical protein